MLCSARLVLSIKDMPTDHFWREKKLRVTIKKLGASNFSTPLDTPRPQAVPALGSALPVAPSHSSMARWPSLYVFM